MAREGLPLAGKQADARAIDDSSNDEHGLVLNSTHDNGAGNEDDTGNHHGVSTTEMIANIRGKYGAN